MPDKEEKISQEDARIQAISKAISQMLQHEGWEFARSKLVEKITELQNIFNIDTKDINSLAAEVGGRKLASEILFAWLKELEGEPETAAFNLPNKKDSHIIRERDH